MINRELDALVAEHIMGWKPLIGKDEIEAAGHYRGPPWEVHILKIWVDDTNKRMACEECGSLPEFTTDPAACQEAKNKMRADGWRYRIQATIGSRDEAFACRFMTDDKHSFATADAELRAVVIAMLRAKGVEVAS